MKKIISLLFLLTLLGALTVPALADVIWTPGMGMESGVGSFFYEHRSECVRPGGNRGVSCEALTDVTLYSDPEEQRGVQTVPVGTEIIVWWIWKDAGGEKWGLVITQAVPDSFIEGFWVRLDGLATYTAKSFYYQHSEEFADRAGTVPGAAGQTVCCYTFPGSGVIDRNVEGDPDVRYVRTYTDEDGVVWGEYDAPDPANDSWICLSDPGNGALPRASRYPDPAWPEPPGPAAASAQPAEEPPVTEEFPEIGEATVGNDAPPAPADASQIEHPGASAAEKASPAGLIVWLVIAVVAASGVLLLLLRREETE